MTNLGQYYYNGATIKEWAGHYGHQWLDTSDVLVNGKKINTLSSEWKNLQPKIFSKAGLNSAWRYDWRGFHQVSLLGWDKLRSTHRRHPTGACYLEIVTAQHGFACHPFIRVENKRGFVWSVGFRGKVAFPYGWRRGVIVSPDDRSWSSGN